MSIILFKSNFKDIVIDKFGYHMKKKNTRSCSVVLILEWFKKIMVKKFERCNTLEKTPAAHLDNDIGR